MTAYDTLLTANDIRLSGLIGSQTDTAQLQNLIIVTEESLFNAYFGRPYYAALFTDAVIYASTPFAVNTIYTVGSYVLFNGLIYEVLQNTTGAQVPAQNAAFFALAPKFTTPANEFLWQRYLKRLLSFAVANEFAIPSSVKQTEKGLIRLKDDNYDAAKTGEIATLKESNYQHIKQSIGVMEAYIMENSASYPLYKRVAEEAQNACNKDEPTAKKYRRNTYGIIFPNDSNSNICRS